MDLQKAATLARAGRLTEAEQICNGLLARQPNHAEALHMMAMIARQKNQFAAAEAFFNKSLEANPNQPSVHANYANMLMATGRLEQAIAGYKKAVGLNAGFLNGWYNMALAFRAAESAEQAKQAIEKARELAPRSAAVLEVYASILQLMGDIEGAANTFRRGLDYESGNARLWCQYGSLLKSEAQFSEAAAAFEKAVSLGLRAPDIYQSLAETYYEQGNVRKAQEIYDTAIRDFPKDAHTHFMRAKFWWETGHNEDHLAAIKAAIQANGSDTALWGAYFDLLAFEGRYDKILEHLVIAREHCAFEPRLRLAEAVALSALGRGEEATKAFEALLEIDPEGIPPKRAFAEHLVKVHEFDRAARVCDQILDIDPYDQMALVMQGTAWEQSGNPKAKWLMDYERMVIPVDIEAPVGYESRAAFFDEVRAELEKLHQMEAHPLDQTLRGGTQTNGFLFRLKNPILQQLKQQIEVAIQSVLDNFPNEQDHPFWGRHRGGFEFKGAWSVRLKSQGFHTNHYHPEGWFSSALYIALPDVVNDENADHQGWIQFGVPTAEIGLEAKAKRVVKPEIGKLVLFPSYMWHGTVPFVSDDPRITVAFDFVPKPH